jgi:serine/threonine protein kinase
MPGAERPKIAAASDANLSEQHVAPTLLCGRYRIERELGRGGMAVVYAGEDVKHHRLVAVKVLHPEVAAAVGQDRFVREIEVAATLQHPNILPLYDSGIADVDSGIAGSLFYVMPRVAGASLRARIDAEGQLPIDDALQIGGQVAEALAYAHQMGVVHRDIKPENILLDGSHAVVADFGIAKTLDDVSQSLTATGVAIGTPAYMSPEQSVGERRVDARTDIYALGCVLYEMLTGEPPFTGPNVQAVIAKRLAGAAPSVRLLRPKTPATVDRAIARALERVPADRFASAAEFKSALHAETGGVRESSHLRWIVSSGLVLAAVAGLVIWTWRARGEGPRLAVTRSPRVSRDSIAVDLVQRARTQADRRSEASVQRAVSLYREAIERDSNYADAWAGMAHALQFARVWRYSLTQIGVSPDAMLPMMVRASERALESDSTSANAWIARASVLREVDPTSRRGMLDAVRRALQIDSMSTEAWYLLASVWQDSLEVRNAIDAYRRTVSINARYSSALSFLAISYVWLRKNDSALVWADSAKAVDPSGILVRQAASLVRRARRDWSEAAPEYEAVVRLGTGADEVHGWAGLAELAWRRGDRRATDSIMTHAIAAADTVHPSVHDAAYLAWAFAGTGDRERALRLLERFEPRFDLHFQLHLQRDPTLDPLRGDPRFVALLRRGVVPVVARNR